MGTKRYDPDRTYQRAYNQLAPPAKRKVIEEYTSCDSSEIDWDAFLLALRAAEQTARTEALAAADKTREAGREWQRTVRRMLADNPPCHYCGIAQATAIDHVHPWSRGGSDEPDNLVPACRPCNSDKLDLTVEEWREMRLSEGRSWPPTGRRGDIADVIAQAKREGWYRAPSSITSPTAIPRSED